MRRKRHAGFTLIELMLVVAIVGLLSAIAIPKFSNLILRAKESSNKGVLGSLRSTLNIYYADNEGITPCLEPFPGTGGFGVVHGKYIDLNKLAWNYPANSAGPANASYKRMVRWQTLYTRFVNSPFMMNRNYTLISDYNDHSNAGLSAWDPIYYAHTPGGGCPGRLGKLVLGSSAGSLTDSRGSAWSTW